MEMYSMKLLEKNKTKLQILKGNEHMGTERIYSHKQAIAEITFPYMIRDQNASSRK